MVPMGCTADKLTAIDLASSNMLMASRYKPSWLFLRRNVIVRSVQNYLFSHLFACETGGLGCLECSSATFGEMSFTNNYADGSKCRVKYFGRVMFLVIRVILV